MTNYENDILEKLEGNTPKKKYENLLELIGKNDELLYCVAHEFFRLGKYSGNISDTCFSDNYKKLIMDIKNVSK
jgi:hypothetical protein